MSRRTDIPSLQRSNNDAQQYSKNSQRVSERFLGPDFLQYWMTKTLCHLTRKHKIGSGQHSPRRAERLPGASRPIHVLGVLNAFASPAGGEYLGCIAPFPKRAHHGASNRRYSTDGTRSREGGVKQPNRRVLYSATRNSKRNKTEQNGREASIAATGCPSIHRLSNKRTPPPPPPRRSGRASASVSRLLARRPATGIRSLAADAQPHLFPARSLAPTFSPLLPLRPAVCFVSSRFGPRRFDWPASLAVETSVAGPLVEACRPLQCQRCATGAAVHRRELPRSTVAVAIVTFSCFLALRSLLPACVHAGARTLDVVAAVSHRDGHVRPLSAARFWGEGAMPI